MLLLNKMKMQKEKYIVFDSGSLINFTSNGLIDLFRKLKAEFNGEFLITNEIKHEVVDHPINVQRFEWGALRIKELLDEGIFKIAEKGFVNGNEMKRRARKIMHAANSSFIARGRAVHLIDEGEAEILAVAQIFEEQKKQAYVVIDERTARVLCEAPMNLQKLLKKKLHTDVRMNKDNFNLFRRCKVIRSTELAFVAYKKGFIKVKDKKALEALIYALKFGGCSISEKEVIAYKGMR
jgi:hypothetical protein